MKPDRKNTIEGEIKSLLLINGASEVGFANIEKLYSRINLVENMSNDSTLEQFDIPHYRMGISIILAYPKDIIKGISSFPTIKYYDAYHKLNKKLDELAILCSDYIKSIGYNAYPQTISNTKEYGIYRTIMPHKTVATSAGLGWIGKSALFVTEKYGSAIRLTSVLTDIPLNYNKTNMASKCGDCMICVDACPGNAISGKNWEEGVDRDQIFNAISCRKKARELSAEYLEKQITLCGKCIEVCPYTRKYLSAI